ncbi:hypothetical protein [Paenibacillus sp. Soil522]|uniref:hypothetical protein n=1 Tax=Paenibacillus sp. Soil522 TaxID=1736388 RepID=UPI0006F7B5BC|nr:hypothetical protein [Paenibacillus sp. Soil522]KRE28292.1 hypothetical protein ASG81_26755 [Paenibacillus sp. Soil522]
MRNKFESVDELREFIVELAHGLITFGNEQVGTCLLEWSETFFTTTSEMLGELHLILMKVKINEVPRDKRSRFNEAVRASLV